MTKQEKNTLKKSLDVMKNAFQDSLDAIHEWLSDSDDAYEEAKADKEELQNAENSFNTAYRQIMDADIDNNAEQKMKVEEKMALLSLFKDMANAFENSLNIAYYWVPGWFKNDEFFEDSKEAREKINNAETRFDDANENIEAFLEPTPEELLSKLGLVVLPKDDPTEALRHFLKLHMAFRLENFHKVDIPTDQMVEDLTNHFLKHSDVLFRYDDIDSIIYSYLQDKEEQEC